MHRRGTWLRTLAPLAVAACATGAAGRCRAGGLGHGRGRVTVAIDVIDPRTGELLWRGGGETRVSDNPNEYPRQLTRAVDAIVATNPAATPPSVAFSGGLFSIFASIGRHIDSMPRIFNIARPQPAGGQYCSKAFGQAPGSCL